MNQEMNQSVSLLINHLINESIKMYEWKCINWDTDSPGACMYTTRKIIDIQFKLQPSVM